ncbi:MAG: pentapeptide repeat-containing protein [Phycisphaerae bacterium]|nr:pentapeptide repeat-containing protein [Phycisphaerae bacterium]
MDESESKAEESKEERRFDPELLKKGLRCDLDQYKMLKRCSLDGNIDRWNNWRKNNPSVDIELEGQDFSRWWLKDVMLRKLAEEGDVYLQRAVFNDARLESAKFNFAHLQNTTFIDANLESAIFYKAHLQGADFQTVLTNGATSFWESEIDRESSFLGVSLDTVRIHPKTKQLLEYNIRRKNWEEWYKNEDVPITRSSLLPNTKMRLATNRLLKRIIRRFWGLSDYGRSTGRIIEGFFALAMLFAIVYYTWGALDYYVFNLENEPGIVSNLFANEHGVVKWWLVPSRTMYFSVVTMTTLGFGDMYANAQSIWGHILLTIQVILGYVLLGALVTRFAVLFTAGGPAGTFADEERVATKTRRHRRDKFEMRSTKSETNRNDQNSK